MINYLDLFSGCGGFRLGLDQANVKIGYEAHSDIDKYANETYKRHYPESEPLNDIRSIRPVRGKLDGHKINLITFGFPCQDISVAGKGAGLAGSRSGLFFEAIRLVRELKPEVFIFENVKGLFSSNEGRDFTTVLREIADIGLYDCEWQLLNTRWFLPQNRERVYFVGHLRGKSRPKVFPITGKCKGFIERSAETTVNCITAGGNSGGHHSGMTLIAGVLTPNREKKRQNGPRFKDQESFTLTTQDIHGVTNYDWVRRLTPVECCRLHGFPDNWVNHLSDTQAYKQMGNTVSPVVTTEVYRKIYS